MVSRAHAFRAHDHKGALIALAGLAMGAFITLLLASILYLPNYVVTRDLGVEDKRTIKSIRTEEKNLVEAKNQVRTALLQAIGGIFLSATAYFTWRQIRQGREGQMTERFTKAIEHLSKKDDLDIRLGGIHALERVGRDSKSDRAAIVDILSAYVRGHSPWQEPVSKEPSSGGLLFDAQGNKAPAVRPGEVSQPSELRSLQVRAPDVQAALDALTRSSLRSGHDERIDLEMTDLRRADLKGAGLEGAHLGWAHLEHAYLKGALANKDTEWPDGFDYLAAGVIRVDAPEAEAPSPS